MTDESVLWGNSSKTTTKYRVVYHEVGGDMGFPAGGRSVVLETFDKDVAEEYASMKNKRSYGYYTVESCTSTDWK